MKDNQLLLIHSNILPPVYLKVVKAKQLLENGTAKSASEAARLCGISRSAFYKYKDYVFLYNQTDGEVLSLEAVLTDEAGVLSTLLKGLYEYGANVLTVNQGVPLGGQATVSITVAADNLKADKEAIIKDLSANHGIISIRVI